MELLYASNTHPIHPKADQTQGVHGISTRKVYPPRSLPTDIVRSYRTFSPLPHLDCSGAWRLFSVTLAMLMLPSFNHLRGIKKDAQTPPVRWCGALCCPDFPPRFSLPSDRKRWAKATERSVVQFFCKIGNKGSFECPQLKKRFKNH